MNPRQRAALEEVEHATLSMRHDMFLMSLSLNVILAECREALDDGTVPRTGKTARLIVIEADR